MVVGATAVYLYIEPKLPSIENLSEVRMQVPLRVYSADEKLMAEFGEKRRIPLSFKEIPPQVVQAFLSAEDDRFFEHPGVDYRGLIRAAVTLALTGQRRQGGSTITMQVARNFFLSREKTYTRKLTEIFLSLKIESQLSKEQILELYLNKIYLGNRAYGVGAAAYVYYGKNLSELTLPQAAMIAGLPKAPSRYNPIINPKRALLRRNYVLKRLNALGYISDAAHAAAKQAPVTAKLHTFTTELDSPYIAEMVRKEMVERFGEEAYTNGYSVYTTLDSKLQTAADNAVRGNLLRYDRRHGYRGAIKNVALTDGSVAALEKALKGVGAVADLQPAIVTSVEKKSVVVYVKGKGLVTLEWDGFSWARKFISENRRGRKLKKAAEVFKVGDVVRVILNRDDKGKAVWMLGQIPKAQSAMVVLNPKDGGIMALVGGFDYYRSKFNRATQAMRQPGSGFKAVVYSAALDNGFTAATLVNDAPVVSQDLSSQSASWRPENYTGKFYGPTRLRKALANSRNLVSIRVLREVGVPKVLEHAERFGFKADEFPKNLTLALGTGEVAPLDMARSYAVLANGGFLVEPYLIQRIEENHKGIIFKANPLQACEECEVDAQSGQPIGGDIGISAMRPAPRAISPQNNYLMTSMLQDVIQRGTATDAKKLGRKDLAGKTGTTNDQRDAWFNGYNPDLVSVVWVGFDNYSPLGRKETGGKAALPAWIDFMSKALKDVPDKPLQLPAGMYKLKIDPKSGRPAVAGDKRAISEYFRVGGPPRKLVGTTEQELQQAQRPLNAPVESVVEDLF